MDISRLLVSTTSLPVMVVMSYPNIAYPLLPNYNAPTVVDGLKLLYHRLNRSGLIKKNCLDEICQPSFEYLNNVPLTYTQGSTQLYLLPLMVYLSNLPEGSCRNNIQNYSSVSENADGKYSSGEISKTLRSVGLTPKLIFKNYATRLSELGIKIPGKDYVNYLQQMFELESMDNTKFMELATRTEDMIHSRDYVWYQLPGPEAIYRISIGGMFQGVSEIQKLLCHLYYKTYKSWFDEAKTYIADNGARIHLAHHSVFADMMRNKTPSNLTIHPSVFLSGFVKDMVNRISLDKDNKSYPPEFKSYIPSDVENVRQLVTTVELKGEGAYMCHCVGGDDYLWKLKSGTMLFFHLDVPGERKGATLSLKRYNFKIFSDAFRIKGVEEHEWWVVDQYYGYRDESMRTNTNAAVAREVFLNKYFDRLGSEMYTNIRNDQETLWKIQCEAARNDSLRGTVLDFPMTFGFDVFGHAAPHNHQLEDWSVGRNTTTSALENIAAALAITTARDEDRRTRLETVLAMHQTPLVDDTAFLERVKALHTRGFGLTPDKISIDDLHVRFGR